MNSHKLSLVVAIMLIGSIVSVSARDDRQKLADDALSAFLNVFDEYRASQDPKETRKEIEALKTKLEAAHSTDRAAWDYVRRFLELANTQEKGNEKKVHDLQVWFPIEKYPKIYIYLEYYKDEYRRIHSQ